jgi:hypothetical protein
MSAYEGEQTIFGLLGQANLTQMMFSNSIHLPANDNFSFFFMAVEETYLKHSTHLPQKKQAHILIPRACKYSLS